MFIAQERPYGKSVYDNLNRSLIKHMDDEKKFVKALTNVFSAHDRRTDFLEKQIYQQTLQLGIMSQDWTFRIRYILL